MSPYRSSAPADRAFERVLSVADWYMPMDRAIELVRNILAAVPDLDATATHRGSPFRVELRRHITRALWRRTKHFGLRLEGRPLPIAHQLTGAVVASFGD